MDMVTGMERVRPTGAALCTGVHLTVVQYLRWPVASIARASIAPPYKEPQDIRLHLEVEL